LQLGDRAAFKPTELHPPFLFIRLGTNPDVCSDRVSGNRGARQACARTIQYGKGWVGFDYANGLGCAVKVINDAAMQAMVLYQGGRMLFLGLGTGLGSAMIVDGLVEPMELAHPPYEKGKTYADLGLRVSNAWARRNGAITLLGSWKNSRRP
jgi:hypothetical protein